MPSTREQNVLNLQSANRHRIAKTNLRKQLRAGEADLGPVLTSRYTGDMSVLEVLGLAFVGRGCHGRRAARLALTVAASMPFTVSHWTTLRELGRAQKVVLYREFTAVVIDELESRADSRAAR